MFVTLVGVNADGAFEILVGSPTLADEILGTSSPFALAAGVRPHRQGPRRRSDSPCGGTRSSTGRDWASASPLAELRDIADDPGGEALLPAVDELVATREQATPRPCRSGTGTTSPGTTAWSRTARATGKHVYLPTFGHGEQADLAIIDRKMQAHVGSARVHRAHAGRLQLRSPNVKAWCTASRSTSNEAIDRHGDAESEADVSAGTYGDRIV